MRKIKIVFLKLYKFIKISNKEKIDFLRAVIYSGIARVYILFFPFNKLRKNMGNAKTESPSKVDKQIEIVAENIGKVVLRASNYTPWESKCLVQALTAQWILKKRGVSTTIYLGLKKDNQENMLAHAWLRCGECYVTGGSIRKEYVVVAMFSN